MEQQFLTVTQNSRLAPAVYKMRLEGDVTAITKPGQFINIKLDGFYLRRPISVYDLDEKSVTIIYKAVGHGTEYMTTLENGAKLDVLTGLGNGCDLSRAGEKPLLLGGGLGVPPMYLLAKKLIAQEKTVTAILGFNTAEEIFCADEFEKLGAKVIITTTDGSSGVKGFVTDAMKELSYTHVFCCGPEPMLRAVYENCKTSGQFSFEERMGCGFGACMGCSCKTITGSKRICKDGPVLFKEEILWDA
ncbi:MAG: dihydroorotate dehydrogenase electron transfer subunit [Synergistaceae bacterium]|nr:dihydroorotate dehydrogenase electron transfer subunit [Synergistaceae bacterium]